MMKRIIACIPPNPRRVGYIDPIHGPLDGPLYMGSHIHQQLTRGMTMEDNLPAKLFLLTAKPTHAPSPNLIPHDNHAAKKRKELSLLDGHQFRKEECKSLLHSMATCLCMKNRRRR
jgi:hypothetical protein